MAHPEFTHIHCSSRFDRSAESLETALDGWMDQASLITLTEVANQNRAARLREKGWSHVCATQKGGRADDAAVCWNKTYWNEKQHWVRRLYGSFRSTNQVLEGLWATTALLKHTTNGQTLLVSVSHLPHDVVGKGGFKTVGEGWRARKVAYQTAMQRWATHIGDLNRKKKPDAVMIVADFNISQKADWFRDYMDNRWKHLDLRCAWKNFPTGGTGPGGGLIDGTWYHGMTTDGAHLMAHDPSSDHTPYKEVFTLGKSEPKGEATQVTGHHYKGKEWWGFGDYLDEDLYELARATGEEGGEVL